MALCGKSAHSALLMGASLALSLFAVSASSQPTESPRTAALKPTSAPYIDAHVHILQTQPEQAVNLLLDAMKRLNGARAFVQTEPYGVGNPGAWDVDLTIAAIKKHSDKLAALGGGGTLNPMIIEAQATGNTGPEVQKKFRETAEALLKQGIAGFGEMSIEHFSLPQS